MYFRPNIKKVITHEKIKMKPPIPRMNSKTPLENTDQLAREKSPTM